MRSVVARWVKMTQQSGLWLAPTALLLVVTTIVRIVGDAGTAALGTTRGIGGVIVIVLLHAGLALAPWCRSVARRVVCCVAMAPGAWITVALLGQEAARAGRADTVRPGLAAIWLLGCVAYGWSYVRLTRRSPVT